MTAATWCAADLRAIGMITGWGEGLAALPADAARAAATLEAIACLLAARHGLIPHTLGFEEPDPECGLDIVAGAPRTAPVRVSLSTSLGFGGCNAALVLEGEPS